MRDICRRIINCRVCKGKKLVEVLSLGATPLANAFLNKEQVDQGELYFPLSVYFCLDCSMLQLGHVVSAEVLFKDYVYVSSTSPVFVKHFEDFAGDIFERFSLNSSSLVVDIGSNDGILLKPFKKLGVQVLGIDPAEKIARIASKEGIPTLPNFFSVELAKVIVDKEGGADVVTGTNVFAHIDDLDEVIRGVKVLLKKEGVFVIEAPYLIDFLEKRYFDLVYHEHLSYWSVRTLMTLFKRFDMVVCDVQKVAVHGGSIRVFVKNADGYDNKVSRRVVEFVDGEEKAGLDKEKTYRDFGREIQKYRLDLINCLGEMRVSGKRIAAYGAPAKGNTLLNFFNIGADILDYVVDDSPWKQGLYTPGKRIPVVSSKVMYSDRVDFMLILAWNFAESIVRNHEEFHRIGGRFIVPVPALRVI